MPSRTWIALLTIAGLALACEQQAGETEETAEPAVDLAAEEQAIRDFADQYEQAYNSGNPDAVIALYTSESSEIAADGTAEPHDASVRATMSESPGSTISIDHERTVVASSGDLAYDMGTFTITAIGPDSQPIPLTMRYLVGLKKVDGAWKLDVTMASNPIGGMTPGVDTTAAPAGP
jgi:ketosteroid isomerase-like protein